MSVPDADRRVVVGHRRRAREARIDDDQLRLAVLHRLGHPLEAAGVGFGGVAAHDQDQVGVLDVDPVVGHRTSAECRAQTGHRWRVSYSRLGIEGDHPEAARDLDGDVAGFVGRRRWRRGSRAVFQRLTVTPLSFFATKFLSRSAFMCLAMRSNASSQEMRFHSFEPGARTSGYLQAVRAVDRSRARRRPWGRACRD